MLGCISLDQSTLEGLNLKTKTKVWIRVNGQIHGDWGVLCTYHHKEEVVSL
jgi:hypothetical protein